MEESMVKAMEAFNISRRFVCIISSVANDSAASGTEPKTRGAKSRGIPHLAKNERDTPNFLQVDEARSTCAPFFEERRMKSREPTKPDRKSGIWGTHVRGGARALDRSPSLANCIVTWWSR